MYFRGSVRSVVVLLPLLLSVMACGLGPVDPAGPAGEPSLQHLRAVALDDSTVGLRWESYSFADSFSIRWEGDAYPDSGTFAVAGKSAEVTGLRAGHLYLFTVVANRDGRQSAPASLHWAPATHYTTELFGDSLIRIYETVSPYGSGLLLDPQRGGPKRVSLDPLAGAQLGLFTLSTTSDHFEIGVAYAQLGGAFDSLVYISTRTYNAIGLDDWFLETPLDADIPTDGNRRIFNLPVALGDEYGRGFLVRTKVRGERHYARVLIRNKGGMLLQGVFPNRYVEIEVSYQMTPDFPYAGNYRSDDPPTLSSRSPTGQQQ